MATTVPVTGLTQLGNVLMQGSADYANNRLRQQDIERIRAQQLADLQDQRLYNEGQRDIERGMRLEDETRRRGQAVDDATLEILLKEGWLSPNDARNPDAIRAAAEARQKRISATQQREGELPAKLQQEADYLGQQESELAAAEDQLNAILSAPQPPPPSNAEVRKAAIAMTGKAVPSDAEINGYMQAAADQIMKQRFLQWSMDKEDAKVQIPLLRSQRMSLRQSLSGLLQQGFVPNRTPPPVAPSAAFGAVPPGLRAASPEEQAMAAGLAPPPVAPPAASLQSQEYGGLMGAVGDIGAGFRTAGAVLQNPLGAAEVAGRAALAVPARALNLFAGGERRLAEGEAEREAGMAGALQRFNNPTPVLNVPSFMGYGPTPANTLSRLPSLPPLRKPPSQSPAFQFGNSYAPGN
jgi:hypothetical protein